MATFSAYLPEETLSIGSFQLIRNGRIIYKDVNLRPAFPDGPLSASEEQDIGFNSNVLTHPFPGNHQMVAPWKTNAVDPIELSAIDKTVRGSIYYSLSSITDFFTEDSYYELKIWNAKYSYVSITEITVDSVEGTNLSSFDYPVGLPEEGTATYTFAVYEDGPASQNTLYTFTIDEEDFTTHITGSRVMSFNFPINWEKEYRFTVEWVTVIQDSKHKREQRRPIRGSEFRKTDLSILVDSVDTSDLLYHWLDFAKTRIIATPIYQEAMFISTDIFEGVLTFTVDTDLTNFTYVEETPYIVIVNHDTLKAEIKVVESIDIGTGTINLLNPLTRDFNKNEVVVYPTYFSTVRDASYTVHNDTVAEVKLSFQEATL